ncbi:hypothetical protein Taro_046330 [Colocasia esculenta]|uniref:Uncharacterized protein n=1 Tax=Colocasia esculenta TaxID=4460 RepID=A0A843WYZ6_COLES|nr:hypothetical protein [Colocasia esculenta]
MDHVCNGCGGRCEANMVRMCGACRFGLEKFEMADRRDWGGGGDDPEENTQCMIERIWESLSDIRMRMDQ